MLRDGKKTSSTFPKLALMSGEARCNKHMICCMKMQGRPAKDKLECQKEQIVTRWTIKQQQLRDVLSVSTSCQQLHRKNHLSAYEHTL